MASVRALCLLAIAGLTLVGCDGFGGTARKVPLPGERVSVLELEKALEPDNALRTIPVVLPSPTALQDWPQEGGNPTHSVGHPSLPDKIAVAWRENVGEGTSRFAQMLATPVVVNGVLYAMDSTALVTARKAKDGAVIWEKSITPDGDESQAWGGGIAFNDGIVYVATGYGQVLALNAGDGSVKWRVPLGTPMRSAPTVADNRLFVITVDNQLFALSTEDGHRIWNYDGIPQSAELAGGSSPAVQGGVVVAPFSSGDVVALRVENGRVVWTDSLAATRRFDAISTIADIRGRPVIDRGRVFAISHSGRMAAIDLRTGERIWEQDIGSAFTPWVAGDYLYVVSTSNQVVCLSRTDGRIVWITPLEQYENPESKKGRIAVAGPVVAGDRLLVVSSKAEAYSISPYTGKPLGLIELPEGSFLPPIVADNTLYLVTNDADIIALR